MRAAFFVLLLVAAVTAAGCGGTSGGGPGTATATPATPPATPGAATATSGSATATPATPAPTSGAPTASGGTSQQRAARRTLVAWYEAQRDQDGERACALMTERARTFYVEGFGGGRVTCAELFGPGGVRLFAVGARFSSGAAKAATVALSPSGRTAVAAILDDTQPLRREGDRWLVDQP